MVEMHCYTAYELIAVWAVRVSLVTTARESVFKHRWYHSIPLDICAMMSFGLGLLLLKEQTRFHYGGSYSLSPILKARVLCTKWSSNLLKRRTLSPGTHVIAGAMLSLFENLNHHVPWYLGNVIEYSWTLSFIFALMGSRFSSYSCIRSPSNLEFFAHFGLQNMIWATAWYRGLFSLEILGDKIEWVSSHIHIYVTPAHNAEILTYSVIP